LRLQLVLRLGRCGPSSIPTSSPLPLCAVQRNGRHQHPVDDGRARPDVLWDRHRAAVLHLLPSVVSIFIRGRRTHAYHTGTHVAALSILGTGLLLGSALGIIIPEGVEALGPSPPEGHLAAALLVGFAAMATIEHFVGGHAHAHAPGGHGAEEEDIMLARRKSGDAEFDAEAFDPDHAVSSPRRGRSPSRIVAVHDPAAAARAFPLTLGLCFHGLTDGLALGASALAGAGTGTGVARRHEGGADLSVVVFFALLIHKGVFAHSIAPACF
jgi:zinc transporter ZupT